MVLGGCLTCVKYLLFVFNFLFWLAGCVLLGMGIWIVVDPKNFAETGVDAGGLNIGGYGLIIVGSIIMVVGFFGCCGAIRESQCLLVTFFICLFIIFGIILGLGIFYAVNPAASEDATRASYKELADTYDTKDISKEQIDQLNEKFKCCGHTMGLGDFKVPQPPACVKYPGQLCPPAISKAIKSSSVVLAGVALGVGVIMLLGMIFSMMLCCAIRDSSM